MVAENTTTRTPDADASGSWLDQFQEQGTSVGAGGNQPLVLSDPSLVWLVTGADVQVFVVRHRNGAADGARIRLMTVSPGSLLFGHAPQDIDGDTWALLAVGLPDTRVIGLPLASIASESGQTGLQRHSERWLRKLLRAVRPDLGPRTAAGMVADTPLELPAGESAMVYEAPVWVTVQQGEASLFGEAAISSSQGPIPISMGGWIDATSAVTLLVESTVADAGMALARDTVPVLVMRMVVGWASEEDQREHQRLQQEVQADARTTDRALRHILGVYFGNDDDIALDPVASDDPLLTVCQLVGRASGIDVQVPPRMDGPTIDPLRTIARASRFRTRRVLLDGPWWKDDSGPMVGYRREDDAPVALLPRKGGYVAVDGETGTQTVVNADLSSGLQPWSDMLYRPFPQKAMDAMALLRFGFRDTARDAWAIVVLGILGGTLGLATPIATGWLINDIIPESEKQQLLQLSLALMASAIAVAAFTITRNVALLRLEGRADLSVQSAVWDRLLGLPVPFFGKYTAGDLGARALGIDRIRQSLSDVSTTALLAFIFAAPSFALQVVISPSLAAISAVLLVVMLGITWLATRRQVVLQRELLKVSGELQGLVLQLLNGIPKLRIAGAERRAFSVWARSYGTQSDLGRRNQNVQVQLSVMFAVFPAISTLVLFGIYVTYQWETISTGAFLSFNAAFGQIVGAAIGMASAIGAMTSIVPTFERAKPILEALPESDDSKADPGILHGDIEVSGVDFAYNEGDPLTLEDVSFRVRSGEFVALVGPSGAGKSTLLRLLIGFDRPTSGSVLFDGQNLDAVDVQSVRRQMGVVLQNGTVMPGELGQNIIGTTQLTLDDAWEAARLAGLEDDIRAMPMGMHTYVMEGGTTLSGGQRQRLMIARAIVNRPRILIFDEATSALDNRTQDIVRESLEQLNSTRIVIAHRLSTIMRADRIYVLVAGRIVQSGTYDELMAVDGPFLAMAKRQLV